RSGDIAVDQVTGAAPLAEPQIVQVVAIGRIVEERVRVVVVARPEGAPGDPARATIEPDEARRPEVETECGPGRPGPSEAGAPEPPAIMVGEPAPGLVRNPGPAPNRAVHPASVPIGRPSRVHLIRHPGGPVVPRVDPVAVAIELAHSHVHVAR